MRTTLDLDDIALDALRNLATIQKQSIGKVAGDLIIEALRNRAPKGLVSRNGVPLFSRTGGEVVTEELIRRIRDEEGL